MKNVLLFEVYVHETIKLNVMILKILRWGVAKEKKKKFGTTVLGYFLHKKVKNVIF